MRMSPQSVCSLMVLVMVACCGYGLKVDRYNCTFPTGRIPVSAEDGVCIDTGSGDNRELRCASTSTKTPLLSDGDDTTYYLWSTSELQFLSLAIPNNVCVGAIVMTFSNGSTLGIPSLTFEPNETVITSHDGRPGNLVNTTITFTPQYCGQSVRINMERDGTNAIRLTEVTLIEGGGGDSVTETPVATTTTAATTAATTSIGATSVPGPTEDPQYALIGGLVGGGLVIVLLMVMLVVCCVIIYFLYRKMQNLSKTQGDGNDYDYVTTHEETRMKKDIVMEDNPAYEQTREDIVMEDNPAYEHTREDFVMEDNPAYEHTREDIVMEDNPAYEHTREVAMKEKRANDITQDNDDYI